MLILSLGGIDVSDYVSDYTVTTTVKEISAGSSSRSDTFVNWDGTVIAINLTTTSMAISYWGNSDPIRARYLYWFACGY